MSQLRRYEILLPLRFNDGHPIPEEAFAKTVSELRETFGAESCDTHAIEGQWENKGLIHHEPVARVFVDVADTPQNREFFVQLKERLEERFQQDEIWLVTFPVERL
jgi:hypothetical protein